MKDYYGKDCSLLKNKKLWLLDMAGTVYLGNKLFDGTLDLLNKITSLGGKYVFITNNSSKSTFNYVKKVTAMGIKADKDNFYTSADAFARISGLTTVNMHNKVERFGASAFASCSNLKTINFYGTKEEWNAIVKLSYWKNGVGTITVKCTDGDITC